MWLAAAVSLALVHADVVDFASGALLEDVTVLVQDGLITGISANAAVPADAEVLDLRGRTLVPGFIDVHSHVSTSEEALRALRSGITTLRVLGVEHYKDVGLRELRRRGAIEGPEIFAAGYHVGPGPSRSASDEPPESLFLDEPELADLKEGISGPESYRRVTRANLSRGVDWIKTTATARAGRPDTDPREQLMSREELEAVVLEARGAGIGVAAHAHGDEGALAAVEAGVESIEHGTYLSEATLSRMRERGTFLVPTMSVVRDLTEPGGNYDHPFLQVRGRHMLPRVQEVVRRARALGVAVATGTDTGFDAANTIRVQHEIQALAACGYPPLDALRAATVNGAELLGISLRTGALRPGLEADLVAVEGNPLSNLAALDDVLLVVNDGRVVLDRLRFDLAEGEPRRSPIERIAFGSDNEQDKPQEIWEAILASEPDVFVFAGDNIFADTTDPIVYRREYGKLAAKSGFQSIRRRAATLAVWDDHDFGENDAGRDFPGKEAAKEIFLEFFEVPKSSPRWTRRGIYDAAAFGPEESQVQIVLLDTRSFRDPLLTKPPELPHGLDLYAPHADQKSTLLGSDQWRWLEEELRKPALLRLVVSSIQVIPEDHRYESWANFPHERRRLFDLIRRTGAAGVVFLSGDRNLAEISRYDGADYPLYEITSSPMTQLFSPTGGGWSEEPNRHRVSEGNYRYPNFGLVTIDWGSRDVTLEIRDESNRAVFAVRVPMGSLRLPSG
jgi:alkaline phosphatase D